MTRELVKLNMKEKNLLRCILKEHMLDLADEINDSRTNKKDKHCLEKEQQRVESIMKKLNLN